MMDIITVIFASTVLKLSSSLDDSIWLTKLVYNEEKKHRLYIEGTYLFSLTLVTILAYIISVIGGNFSNFFFDNNKYFSLASSFLLIVFAVFFVRKGKEISFSSKKEKTFYNKITNSFFISIVGSIDELIIFTTILSLKEIAFTPLLIGTLIAGVIIILVVQGVSKVNNITHFISKIPTWYLIFFLGIASFLYTLYNLSIM